MDATFDPEYLDKLFAGLPDFPATPMYASRTYQQLLARSADATNRLDEARALFCQDLSRLASKGVPTAVVGAMLDELDRLFTLVLYQSSALLAESALQTRQRFREGYALGRRDAAQGQAGAELRRPALRV